MARGFRAFLLVALLGGGSVYTPPDRPRCLAGADMTLDRFVAVSGYAE